ncbi:hypothetical protein QQG55_20595 [Brugia pahangi]
MHAKDINTKPLDVQKKEGEIFFDSYRLHFEIWKEKKDKQTVRQAKRQLCRHDPYFINKMRVNKMSSNRNVIVVYEDRK